MAAPSGIVERAAERAAARRERFGPSGHWAGEPLDLVATAAARWPSRPAVADRDARATYRELDEAVGVAAARLRSWGVAAGDPVLVVVQNDVASVVGIHAALRSGAVVLVAPLTAGRAQLADIVEEARPAVAVAPDDAIGGGDALPGAGPGWRPMRSLAEGEATAAAGHADAPPQDARRADEPSIVIYTSGTTSRPKGVIHSLATLVAASQNYIDCAELGADDRLFVVSPLASITGMLQCVTVPAMLGAQVVLETRWDPAQTCDLLLERGGSFFGGPDLVLDRLLDEVEARQGTETSLGAVYLGGAMLDPRILERVELQFGIVVMRAYGSSEAPISTAGQRREARDVRLADDGAPLAGVEVRQGSRNDPTECCVTGPHLFLGYVDADDDAHAFERDDDGRDWFCTGDIADLDGGRVRVVGRIRDVVIRKGLKVPIAEVEGYVNRLPGIARSAGYAAADPATGERLAVAVLAEGDAVVDFDEIVNGLRDEGLATWKLPEEIVVWDRPFPENAAGKVLRNELEAGGQGRPHLLAPRLRDGGKR